MKRSQYLALLLKQPAAWIHQSMNNPTRYMGKWHIALHAVALRRLANP
jgi:hypothetical protein